MPKKVMDGVHEIRRDNRVKAKKYPVATVYLQVVGSGAPGAPKSLYVYTEHCRFLFNCGEGTQRLAFENKVKLGMLEHVFITHKSWDNVGGLPGMLLTLQDTGVPQITLHGPPGIESIYYDTKHFMRFSDLNICHENCKEYPKIYGNPGDPLVVRAVPLCPTVIKMENLDLISKKDLLTSDVGDLFTGETLSHSQNQSEVRDDDSRLKDIEESVRFKDLAIAYICQPPAKLGSLRVQKCRELGVPSGPLMGKLKSGNDVTLPNGNVVYAAEVTEPDEPSLKFIVIEIPSLEHIEPLLKTDEFDIYQIGPSDTPPLDSSLTLIVHFTPPHVMLDPRYQTWSNKFPKCVSHFVINEYSQCMGSERVHKVQYKLNHIYSDSFPLLLDKRIEGDDEILIKRQKLDDDISMCNEEGSNYCLRKNGSSISEDMADNGEYNFNGETHQSFTSLMCHIRPNTGIDCSTRQKVTPNTYINECYNEENFPSILNEVRNNIKKIRADIPAEIQSRKFPNFTFLGTGSCIPNKTRNTSGILLNISATCYIILDCGEGTYGQIVRLFGESKTKNILLNLQLVYVSHLHADHHIGLIKLISERKKLTEKLPHLVQPFFLSAPSGIRYYLSSFDIGFKSILDQFHLVPNVMFRKNTHGLFDPSLDVLNITSLTKEQVLQSLPIKDLETCYVRHCPDAYGVKIKLEDDFKIVYSGDTMPCQNLVDLGRGCDILVHEATMEDYLEEDARVKRHSTYAQAIEIGNRMEAKNVILTHFSQRYAKVPLIDKLPSNVIVAFDNMQVSLSDLPCLPLLYPAFVSIFSEDVDDMKEKTNKRKKREQNEKVECTVGAEA